MGRAIQGVMGLPASTGPCSPPKPSPNQSGRDVVVSLTCVGNTASGMITTRVSLKALTGKTPSKPQSNPLQPMLCGGYPTLTTVALPLSGYGPCSGCDLDGGDDLLSHKSAINNQLTSIVAWVCV